MPIQSALGKRIQRLRKDTGLSLERYALQIDMDRTYLASFEAGKRHISLQNIEKIANGLGISIADLFKNLELEDKQ